jgi:hypothetical protein
MKEKYGDDLVDEFGAAQVSGAEDVILEKRSKDYNGTGKSVTEYFRSKNLGGGIFENNDLVDSGLTDKEIQYLADLAGVEYADITDGELEYDNDGWRLYDSNNE